MSNENLNNEAHISPSLLNAGLGDAPSVKAAYAMGAKGGPAVEAERLAFELYKNCAESYEKKLAEKDAELVERDAEIATAEARAASWRCPQCPDKKLQEQLSEANARNAMLVDAITKNHQWHIFYDDAEDYEESELWNENTKAITTNSEAVATWEAKKLEPLRREVSILRNELEPLEYIYHAGSSTQIRIAEALLTTQATAEAFESEVAAKALDNAADEQMIYADTSSGIVYRLRLMASKIRAANKGKEIV